MQPYGQPPQWTPRGSQPANQQQPGVQGMQPAQWGAPIAPPPTVKGLALAPGERVIYYRHDSGVTTRIVFVVLGLLMLVAIVGVILLIVAFTSQAETIVITTQRIIRIDGKKPPEFFVHGQVRRMVDVMSSGLKEINLYDAQERCLSFHVRSNPALRDALRRYVGNPQLVHEAPSVAYDA